MKIEIKGLFEKPDPKKNEEWHPWLLRENEIEFEMNYDDEYRLMKNYESYLYDKYDNILQGNEKEKR